MSDVIYPDLSRGIRQRQSAWSWHPFGTPACRFTHVSCDRGSTSAQPQRELLSLLRPPLTRLTLHLHRAQSRFWAPPSLDAHAILRRRLSSKVWKVYTTICEGTILGTQGPDLGLLAQTVDAVSRNPRPSCQMERVSYVALTLVPFPLIATCTQCMSRLPYHTVCPVVI